MSETKGAAMSETAVERRLRELAADWRQAQFPDKAEADDAGREAIRLLCGMRDGTLMPSEFKDARDALLARCEGETR